METIEEIIGKAFSSDLGQQCNSLFSTSDNRVFVRYEEALKHTKGTLDNTKPLIDTTILEWFEEWHGGSILPDYISEVVHNPTENTDIDNTIQHYSI